LDLNTLDEIINIKQIININEDILFDYFRITNYHDDLVLKDKKNILFFPISILEDDVKAGWYIKEYDMRPKINEIVNNNPHYYFIIEDSMIKDMPKGSRYIVVNNIMESINKLFEYKLNNYKGQKVCVTGSVGKTTTVGFIKAALGDKALRIYSKRITPLILNNFVINYLNNDVDYFIVEASLWYKEHITYFSKILKPDLVVLLDVLDEHVGIGNIKTISDITKYKSYLLEYASNVIINNMDKELNKININNNEVYYNNEEVVPTKVKNVIKIDEYNNLVNPYIKTRLTLLEETIAFEVAKYYNIDEKTIIDRLNKAKPVENRIEKENVYDHEIIFDGDVSGVARFNGFSDHYYDKSCLVICDLTENGEENEDYNKLNDLFDKFDYVFVHKDLKKYFNNKKIQYFEKIDFIKNLPNDVEIFMHYGSYFRKYDKFDVKKLEKR